MYTIPKRVEIIKLSFTDNECENRTIVLYNKRHVDKHVSDEIVCEFVKSFGKLVLLEIKYASRKSVRQ